LKFDRQAVVAPGTVRQMLDTIRHRGPDGEGTYVSGQVGLGHRRLSIIDLSTGQQPLANEDGTVWIVFNGEIYNYQGLRSELLTRGHVFRTQSDTEVIVHLYEEYGEACVEKLRGMFAFAIWDDRRKLLFIARDRVGIKPLYYLWSDKSLIFASEIKSILADPEVKAEVVPEMIDRFLTYYYLPGEDTLFRNIHKLTPGSYMTVRDGQVTIGQYWDLHFVPSNLSLREAQERLMELLEESVRLHMIADVPVGFLLSGGVDSTAMLGLAVGKTERPISSYTIGFSELGDNDERPYARFAARSYGSAHHETTISAKDFVDFFPKYVWHMEEPVCEPPAVALYYVSRLARDFVKVLISGEGGDEAFAGYPNYRNNLWFERLKAACKPVPGLLSMVTSLAGGLFRSRRIAKYRLLVDVPLESYYYSRTSGPYSFFNLRARELYSKDFARQVSKASSINVVRRYFRDGAPNDMVNRMLYVDSKTWLPDDLLVKADKMTMANSVELRVPLLDHVLLEFAASLPGNYKVHGFTTKYVGKKALNQRVPSEIIARKKAGFPVPYESWLKNDLRDWVNDILLDRQTISRGYFQRDCIAGMIQENQRAGAFSKEIFSLATLELWHRVFLGNGSAPSALLSP
jgi:asparagine synthase (glutamine-hydrolysing)